MEERESIWSIRASLWPWFFLSTILPFLLFLGVSAYIKYQTRVNILSFSIDVFRDFAPLGLSSAVFAYFVFGGIDMVLSYSEYQKRLRVEAENRVKRKEDTAYQKGLEEGRRERDSKPAPSPPPGDKDS